MLPCIDCNIIFSKGKKIGGIVLLIYSLFIIFSNSIRSIDNQFIVWYNSKVFDVENLKTPILGYKRVISTNKNNVYDVPFDVMFKFDDFFGIHDALIFKKDHGLNMGSFDGDYSLHKIYNKDWWWYKKGD